MKAILWLTALTYFLDSAVHAADNIACPEQIGAELQACQHCGNEDANNQGHCANTAFDRSQCGCNPATVTISQETSMVIAVPSGATANITGTYALATLTAYSNLRQSISTTVTSSPTQPGQPVVTAAVVIFAGGVAWYLAGVAGAVGDEAAILTPPDEAGGHPDDSQCPNAKPTCSDCGGINSICILPSAGCTCEDSKPETCPQQKPNCDAETCKGDENNKCTVENKGCGCVQAGPTCPDATEAMFCSQCGGEGSDVSKCSDGAPCCVGPENQGCPCYQGEDPNIFEYENPTDPGLAGQWWDRLRNGAHNKPACEGTSKIDTAFFENIYHQFCATANDGQAHEWTQTVPADAPAHVGFQFKFKATGGGACKSCEAAFSQIIGTCVDSTKVVANKGSLDIGCGSYSYEIQVPPEPTPPSPTPTIDPHVRTVECFPTHGASDADQIVFLALPDFIIDPFCKGTEPTWMRNGDAGQQPIVPASYNHYDSTFTIASNAPELCKQVYKEEGKNNVEVQNFCQAPLKAIRDQCKYNGGKVKSDCGEWTIQSCPNGGICKLGEPGKHCKTDPGNNFCL